MMIQRRAMQQILQTASRQNLPLRAVQRHQALRSLSTVAANFPRGGPPMASFYPESNNARHARSFSSLGGMSDVNQDANTPTSSQSGSSGITIALNCSPCCVDDSDDGG